MSAVEEMEMDVVMERGMKEAKVEELMGKANEFAVLSDILISFVQNEPTTNREEVAVDIIVTVKRMNRMSEKQKRVLIACLVEREAIGYKWR